MRAVIKKPGESPEIIDVDNDLKPLQEAVGGYIEHFSLTRGIGILCDEDGRFKGPVVDGRVTSLPYTFAFDEYVVFVGAVLFVGESGDDFTDLTDEQVDLINRSFEGIL